MTIEWVQRKKPSVLGIVSGAVAGLGTITPASGFILPWHGLVIGAIAGGVCYWACIVLKQRLKYDDSLDVFGVHGVGGVLGVLLAGVFATGAVSATAASPEGLRGLIDGNAGQLGIQAIGVVVTVAWCAIATWGILKLIDAVTGLRVDPDQEREGLDLALHGESLHQ
jgi:Amt family ammonium transporter